jgi:hypothetical protein
VGNLAKLNSTGKDERVTEDSDLLRVVAAADIMIECAATVEGET